jgi:hypothetical protein
LAGFLFASTFTVAIGGLIFINLASSFPLLPLAIIGGLGAVATDLAIFIITRKNIPRHISPVYQNITGSHFKKILHTKYFSWTLPVIGALIIASPLPDELGVSLLGISEVKNYQFAILSYCSHLIGISLILSASLI